MKKKTHPKYNENTEVICDCGAKFKVASTAKKIHTEICYKCNPLYTGEKKIVDAAGRVEKFKARSAKTSELQKNPSKKKKKNKQEANKKEQPKSKKNESKK